MNGEDLVYDWQHNVVDDATEWAFNWNYAEGGTAKPVPREHHATMWLSMNAPVIATKIFFKDVAQDHPVKLITKNPSRSGEGMEYEFTVIQKRTKEVLLTGTMKDPDPGSPDPNVGNYATFKSTTEAGFSLIKNLVKGTQMRGVAHGMIAFIPHERIELPIGGGYTVVSTTGEGPDGDRKSMRLATRFTLFHKDEEVARCHMTYRDGSWDPSMGPTIEMIAVKQSRRGEGLAKVLWYWVRRFIEDNFTIECLNNDAPLGHVMVKATQIGTNEVDIRVEKDGSRHPMTFKEFLFDYCEFSVREQKGAAAFVLSSQRPKDEEAVLYIPLLSKEELASRPRAESSNAPKPGNAVFREKCGARMCHWCTKVNVDLSRCSRCGTTFYCDRSCQKNDYNRHKKWCGKTREQVRELLIKEGGMIRLPDGKYSLVMNAPGRNFGGLGGLGGLRF
jgi:hypothetical protein